jgi:hypothetical protein
MTMVKICPNGHAVEGDNARVDSRGSRICVACSRAQRKAWRERNPQKSALHIRASRHRGRVRGNIRNGYYKGNIERTVTREHVAQVLEMVREHGTIAGAFPILGQSKTRALMFFRPKLRVAIDKIKADFAKRKSVITAVPAVTRIYTQRSPASAQRIMQLIGSTIPPWVARDHRDDVAADMLEAWWSGRLLERDIASCAKLFINSRFKIDHNKWGTVSLDAPLTAETTKTLGDILPADRQIWSEGENYGL